MNAWWMIPSTWMVVWLLQKMFGLCSLMQWYATRSLKKIWWLLSFHGQPLIFFSESTTMWVACDLKSQLVRRLIHLKMFSFSIWMATYGDVFIFSQKNPLRCVLAMVFFLSWRMVQLFPWFYAWRCCMLKILEWIVLHFSTIACVLFILYNGW